MPDTRTDLAPDLSHVEPLIDRLLRVAGLHDGIFVVAGLGEDPDTDIALPPEIVHVSNRQADRRNALIAAVEQVSRRRGANAYIAPALFRADLPPGKKGAEADVLWQLAIVSDFDQKQDPATRQQRLPILPHAEVETSPGNFQSLAVLRQTLSAGPGEAGPPRACGEDGGRLQERRSPLSGAGLPQLAQQEKAGEARALADTRARQACPARGALGGGRRVGRSQGHDGREVGTRGLPGVRRRADWRKGRFRPSAWPRRWTMPKRP